MRLITLPGQVPRRGSVFWRFMGRTVLRLGGWNVEGEVPDLPKFVIAVAPHTSNWDFVVGTSTMFALDFRLAFLGKHTLFAGVFGSFMRWMGGIPVDRTSPHGAVADAVASFGRAGSRILVIAPEGTRKRVARFRTGFLQIARGAGVPVVLCAFDYAHKRVLLGPTIFPGEDVEADRVRVEAHFALIRGCHPR